jgi:tetratricopeptide (TPR) repeat protein
VVEPEYLISSSDVRSVLESTLRGDLVRGIGPLDDLFVVEQHLIEKDLPAKSPYRRLVLVDLLSSEISVEYKQRRTWVNRHPPHDYLSLPELHQLILEDSDPSGDPTILGWLWLYLKYVRKIPELRSRVVAQYAHIDRRTLRRYQNLALQQLTIKLIQMEIEARTNRRHIRLKAQLPRLGRVTCIGRDKEIQWIVDLLGSDSYRPVLIVGVCGIGKSILAEAVASRLIENESIDSVIWIENYHSVNAIEDHLRERFLEDCSTTTIQEFLFFRRVLIVLDNVDPSDVVQFGAELQRLQGARLIITSRSLLRLYDSQVIRLDGLSLSATKQFLAHLDSHKEIPQSMIADVAATVHHLTSGNPLQVEDQYRQYVLFRTLAPVGHQSSRYHSLLYKRLSPDARLAWAVLSIGPIRYSDLENGLFPGIAPDALHELASNLIIETVVDAVEPFNLVIPAMRQSLQDIYSQDTSLQIALKSWIARIARSESLTDILVNFLEQILQASWIGMDSGWRTQCIKRIWWNGVADGRWNLWASLLEFELTKHPALSETSVTLTIGYAMCLRRLGHVGRATKLFRSSLQGALQLGLSTSVALIHLELAVSDRANGYYTRSMDILTTTVFDSHSGVLSEDCLQWIKAEQAQLCIERGLFSEARVHLNKARATTQVQLIRAELAIRLNEFELGENIIFDLLSTTKLKSTAIGRAYTLLGISRHTQGDTRGAKRFFAAAETMFETSTDDPYGIARAKSNLAAVLIELGSHRSAAKLLQDAARIQKAIQDHVGLATTIHNQGVLNRKQ